MKYVWITFGIVAGGGLIWLIYKLFWVVSDFKKLQVTPVGLSNPTVNMTKIEFDASFEFKNQAAIKADVSKVYLDVKLNGNAITPITDTKGFTIPAEGSVTQSFHISVPTLTLGQTFITQLFNVLGGGKPSLTVEIEGYAEAYKVLRIPIKLTQTLTY